MQDQIQQSDPRTLVLATLLVILVSSVVYYLSTPGRVAVQGETLPPHVPHSIPFIGNALKFGLDPVGYLQECQKSHGDTFTFTMLGMYGASPVFHKKDAK
jgi:sterol 14-demethylase